MNNNNKNNANSVRAVSEFCKIYDMFKLEDIYLAYYDCRKNKRATASCIEFEVNFDSNCTRLHEELNSRTYQISESIAFIVTKPRRREIFAASFRDRVLHHLVDIKLRPLIEVELIDMTYNNRKGKGSSACIKQLKEDIRVTSDNHTKDCWVLKMDMKGFFMSLSKNILVEKVHKFIDEKYFADDADALKWLVEVILRDNPEKHCFLKSDISMWDDLDKSKSLFHVPDDLGLPIGNLISQLLANFYLNDFDHYASKELGFSCYGRYVDDFYIVSTDKEKMLSSIPLMREKLQKVGVTLHPHKFYFQHYSKGVEMLGAIVKTGRSYVHIRTINNAFQKVRRMTIEKTTANENDVAVINSYLGLMGAHRTFKLRRKLVTEAMKLDGISAPSDFKKVILRSDLKEDYLIIQKLKRYEKANKRNVRSN